MLGNIITTVFAKVEQKILMNTTSKSQAEFPSRVQCIGDNLVLKKKRLFLHKKELNWIELWAIGGEIIEKHSSFITKLLNSWASVDSGIITNQNGIFCWIPVHVR